jgi:hypothetical protein
MSKPNHVWVIEMRIDDIWYPTIGCQLTRAEGKTERSNWARQDPEDKFRLTKYVVEGKKS